MANINKITILKFLEVALTITCLGLHIDNTGPSTMDDQFVIITTFGGFVVILTGIFIGVFTGEPVGRKVEMFFSLAGCALFVAAGALIIQDYEKLYKGELRNKGLAKGAMAILNGVCFLLDAVFSFRGE